MLFIIYDYFFTISDLCDSGSVHLYVIPGISTPNTNNVNCMLLTLYIPEIKCIYLFILLLSYTKGIKLYT